jgi:HK97 family phage major capsid protein
VAITPSNPTFETLTLTARKFAVLVHARAELLDDNATNKDVFDLVIELAGDAFAILEDTQVFI